MRESSEILALLERELATDQVHEDVTSLNVLEDPLVPAQATIVAKEAGVFCGSSILEAMTQLKGISVSQISAEGSAFSKGDSVVKFESNVLTCLTVERTLLNSLSHACGVASLTSDYVKAVKSSGIQILATRKTLPGLRTLQLQAVVAGGGRVHRRSLSDGILIKDNHLMFQTEEQAIAQASKYRSPLHGIEIEVDSLESLKRVLSCVDDVDVIMLDNFELHDLKTAIELIQHRARIEVSGGITLERLSEFKGLGIDYISVGALTHSARQIDLSLELHML